MTPDESRGPWAIELSGRLDKKTIASEVLARNPLGDPLYERPLWVYLPPGYDDSGRLYPTVYVIQGYTGHVAMWENRSPYRRTFLETADEIFASGSAPACIVVYVDAWTAYGGSQFVDSPGTGRYHSYLCDEVVRWIPRAAPHAGPTGVAGDQRQVVRRVRRDDHADAAARTCSALWPRTPATRSTS